MITVYCYKCGKHWDVMAGLGQWIAKCVACNRAVEICWHPEHCHQYQMQNTAVETAYEGGLKQGKRLREKPALP